MNNVNFKGKLLLALFVVVFLSLQHSLWGGKQNVRDLSRLNHQLGDLENENRESQNRNNRLHKDVIDIKNRLGAIESQARFDLGLIKPGETYYQIVRPGQADTQ